LAGLDGGTVAVRDTLHRAAGNTNSRTVGAALFGIALVRAIIDTFVPTRARVSLDPAARARPVVRPADRKDDTAATLFADGTWTRLGTVRANDARRTHARTVVVAHAFSSLTGFTDAGTVRTAILRLAVVARIVGALESGRASLAVESSTCRGY
jgi:hypothetical protein